jgi:hypothetical protein
MDDMARHGQLDPIVSHEGMILDGRHRYRVCLALDLTPKIEAWSGQCGSPVAFVVSRNLHRRQLSKGQRAAIALDVKDQLEVEGKARMREAGKAAGNGRPKEKGSQLVGNPIDAHKQAASMMDVNHQYVTEAEHIREADPETFEEVKAGAITLPQAKRKLRASGKEMRPRKPRKAKPKDDHADNLTSLIFNPGDPRGNARDHQRYLTRDHWLEYIDEMAKLLI